MKDAGTRFGVVFPDLEQAGVYVLRRVCVYCNLCVSPGWPFYLLRNTELDSHGGSEIRGKLWVAERWRAAAAAHRKRRTASHTLRSAHGGGGKCFTVRSGSRGMLKLSQGPFNSFGVFAYAVFQVSDL